MVRVLLLRHAQSEWNALGRWQGQADPPLSSDGQRQARQAARVLHGIDRIVSSDLRRAAQSAEIMVRVLGTAPLAIDLDLRERDVGAWSGLTVNEIDGRWPGYRANGKRPPGWEPNAIVLRRALSALTRLSSPNPVSQ